MILINEVDREESEAQKRENNLESENDGLVGFGGGFMCKVG